MPEGQEEETISEEISEQPVNGRTGGFPVAKPRDVSKRKFARPEAASSKKARAGLPPSAEPKEKRSRSGAGKQAVSPKNKGGSRVQVDDAYVITLLIDKRESPYRAGTRRAELFASLKSGMTVARALAAGSTRGAIRRAVKKGLIKVGPK